MQIRKHRLVEIEVRGLEHVRQPFEDGCGVLVTPNHASHADCFSIYDLAGRFGMPFYVMIAWQNFVRDGALRAWILRQHGGFSVDREGNDLAAFRQAVDVLRSKPNPLVIFPEGDVYHLNDRILPFREGPAAIALSAARRADRSIVIVPCAIKYRYVDDPTPELVEVVGRLEGSIHWRPRTDLTLAERIYRVAEGALSLKEIEYYGHSCSGPLRERIRKLIDFILSRLEGCYRLDAGDATVPERVKLLRQQAIRRMAESPEGSSERGKCEEDVADLFFAVQLFSYPGDYVAEDPSIERIAETIDKLEEDVLGEKTTSAESDDMESIYSSLKITNARIVGGPFSVGDTVTVAYELTNTSYTALRVPVDKSFSRPFNLVGTRQHWIERKGDESAIPGISPRIAREGSKYAAGGSIIPTKSTIGAGESLSFQQRVSTKGYPAGAYTYYIDYKKVRGDTLQTVKVDFELAHK